MYVIKTARCIIMNLNTEYDVKRKSNKSVNTLN